MARYHVSEDGKVRKCNAQPGNCPIGGDDEHYPNKEAAEKAAEEKLAQEYGLLGGIEAPLTPNEQEQGSDERKDRLIGVSNLVAKVSAMQLEKAALYLYIQENKQLGYMAGEMDQMVSVIKAENRFNEIDSLTDDATESILKELDSVYPEWKDDIEETSGLAGLLERQGVEPVIVSEEEQKKITHKAYGKALTMSELTELIQQSQ